MDQDNNSEVGWPHTPRMFVQGGECFCFDRCSVLGVVEAHCFVGLIWTYSEVLISPKPLLNYVISPLFSYELDVGKTNLLISG